MTVEHYTLCMDCQRSTSGMCPRHSVVMAAGPSITVHPVITMERPRDCSEAQQAIADILHEFFDEAGICEDDAAGHVQCWSVAGVAIGRLRELGFRIERP